MIVLSSGMDTGSSIDSSFSEAGFSNESGTQDNGVSPTVPILRCGGKSDPS